MKAKVRYMACFSFVGLLFTQSAIGYYPTYPTTTSTSGGVSALLAIAVGAVFVASSVDCASRYPSLPMCGPGGSSYRGPVQPQNWGSMGSLIIFHDAVSVGAR